MSNRVDLPGEKEAGRKEGMGNGGMQARSGNMGGNLEADRSGLGIEPKRSTTRVPTVEGGK